MISRLVGTSATEDEIEALLASGDADIFAQCISLTDPKHLEGVRSRHEEIVNFERSMKEMNHLWTQMNILIGCQGLMDCQVTVT